MGWSFLSSNRPRQLHRTETPHPPGNSVTAAVLGVAIRETELVTSVEKGLSLIIIQYTLLYIIYYHYLLKFLCMTFTICVACTATSHEKRLYVYISKYCMAVFCSSLMQWIPSMLLRYFPSDFDMVPIAHAVTGITFVLTFHISCMLLLLILLYYYNIWVLLCAV